MLDGLVRVRSLAGYVACVRALGGDPWAILYSLGLDETRLDQAEDWIPFGVVLRAFQLASITLDEPAFGVKLSRSRELNYLGPILMVARHAPDLEQAIHCISRYFKLQNTAVRAAVEISGAQVTRSYHMPTHLRRSADQWIEETLTTFPTLMERICGQPVEIRRFMMRHRPNRPIAEYERQFAGEVLFDQALDGLEFECDLLARPVPNRDLEVYDFLSAQLEAGVARSGAGIEAATRSLLDMLIPARQGRIEVVAGQLGLHPRTLQRHLGKLGYTFSQLLEEQKRAMAERMLRRGDTSLVEIAAQLGYAEQSAFNHAFIRWNGMSPGAWLRQVSRRDS